MGILTLRDVWVRKIQRNFEDHGLNCVFRKTIFFLLRPLYEKKTYRLYKIDLQRPQISEPNVLDKLEFRILSCTDADSIDEVERMSEWLHGDLASQLKEGALCIAAFEHEKLVGFNLISFGNVYMPLINLHRGFRRNEAWSEQIAVSKEFRKKGLGANLRYRIFQELRNRGYRKLYGGALVDNIPSLKLAQRVGFRIFVDITYTRTLNSRKWQYKRLAK